MTDKSAPMEVYGDASWYQDWDFSGIQQPQSVDYKRLLLTANACYNYIKGKPKMTTGEWPNIALVACVGITGGSKAFCASIPRDDMHAYFRAVLSQKQQYNSPAPRWETAFRVPDHGIWAHAEDWAYARFEEFTDLSQAPAGKYPDGTTVAIWTSKSANDRGVGTGWVPCDGSNGKGPSCRVVASRLGVTYAVTTADGPLHNPQGQAPLNPILPPQESRNIIRDLSTREDLPKIQLNNSFMALPEDLVQDMIKMDQIPLDPSNTPPVPSIDIEDVFGFAEVNHDSTTSITTNTKSTSRKATIASKSDHSLTSSAASSQKSTTSHGTIASKPDHNSTSSAARSKTSTTPRTTTSVPQSAQASVTAASSGMHVGTLGGNELYTSVSSALEQICPSVTQTTTLTQCSGTATIPNIDYINADVRENDGEVEVSVPFSSYNVTSLRDAMIKALATTANSTATGKKNCYQQQFMTNGAKRSILNPLSLFRRQIGGFMQETVTFCNTAELAIANYYSPDWRSAAVPGPTDYMEVQYNFHENGGGSFACEITSDLMDGLGFLVPEFTVADVELSEAINAVCEDLQNSG